MIFSLQNCILPRLQVDVLESLRFSNKLLKGGILEEARQWNQSGILNTVRRREPVMSRDHGGLQ